ncbi:hypothetical protein S-CBP4_0043 [Synechococcus phage S-CBP4]|uniref:Uncharacterized protein n=1 Tax=Synechococcus phage S-CBP4 TaxID=754059 RepID=M1Q761_9CAUD|nr:hypothetical protein S-CBP4_0043 [Synechococcus phage S-CBP4]YP_009822193.1 hypothetical protein HOV40_gp09 [Synechococcus phage S-CBP4]AGF91693.1 hypothetical protein SVPG_00009 [Synechococcus phage S-CBP4]AGK86649.1 hypothetical protein S-CBP4_0043 [Synechococcus phage S-CBP4]
MVSRTSKYYKDNPEARKKRLKQQARYNRQSMQIQKRVELNRENRKRGTYGNGDGKDVSHKKMVQQYLKKPQKIELETDLGNDTATSVP